MGGLSNDDSLELMPSHDILVISVVEPEPDFLAGAGAGASEKAPAPGCCLGVLWWQSSDTLQFIHK